MSTKEPLTSNDDNDNPVRIGVYYDGNFLFHVSNYYRFGHTARRRITIAGVHEFIREYIGSHADTAIDDTLIVDAHYFRGRFPIAENSEEHTLSRLTGERAFEDSLAGEGVALHYSLIVGRREKGVNVDMALHAYDAASRGIIDYAVIIAGSADFLPLLRRLHSMGVQTVVLKWNATYTDRNGRVRHAVTSQELCSEAAMCIDVQTEPEEIASEATLLERGAREEVFQ